MHIILSILAIFLALYSVDACENCHRICAAERKDPTNQRTFKKKSALVKYNKNFDKHDESMNAD